MLIFYVNEKHHLDHIIDIYKAYKGEKSLFIPAKLTAYVEDAEKVQAFDNNLKFKKTLNNLYKKYREDLKILVAKYGSVSSLNAINTRYNLILMEHGCGQYYDIRHYFWGRQHGLRKFMHSVKYMLCPNECLANKIKKHNPKLKTYITGSPKLDRYTKQKTNNQRPLIVFSWHWECKVIPETTGGFNYWKGCLIEIGKKYNIALHGHPRIQRDVKIFARDNDIEHIESFDEVLVRADVYACDNSSTLFEFAAIDKPVIVLNNPWFRKDIEQGMRFWEYADIGVQCDDISDIEEAINKAIEDKEHKRVEYVPKIYPYLGESVDRTIEVLNEIMQRGVIDFGEKKSVSKNIWEANRKTT